MKKVQFSCRPDLVTNEGQNVLVCFGVEEKVEVRQEYIVLQPEETTEEAEIVEGEETFDVPQEPVLTDVEYIMYEAYAVRLQHPVTHDRVVDAIVSAAYPNDVMQAITNNHMMGDGNAEHEAEYEAMQAWRDLAKATADAVLGYNQVKEATYEAEPLKIEPRGDDKYVYRWDITEVVIPVEVEDQLVQENEMVEPTEEELDVLGKEVNFPTTEEETEESVQEVEPQTIWKCKEVVFKMPMSVDTLSKIVASASTDDYETIRNEVGLAIIPLDMEAAKKELIDKIIAYDSSEAVNSFSFGGIPMWLDKATRVGLKLRFEAELALGKETTTLWLNGMNFTLPLSGEGNAMNVLTALELYASASYDVTQMHLAMVAQMTTAEEVLAFDWTSGYPEKLAF